MERMHPFFYGFTGDVIENPRKPGSYEIIGKIERTEDETLLITELPVKTWTQDYKVFLEKMTIAEKKEDEIEISDFKENHTDNTVSFTITAPKDKIDSWEKAPGGLLSKFKLTAKLSTTNMTVFNETGRIIKFTSAEKILDYFYDERLKFYNMRKAYLLTNLRREERILSNKARFVEEVCSGDLIVSNRKRAELLSDLEERGYELFPKQNIKLNPENESIESDQEEFDDNDLAKGYEYLLGMKIWSLTYEKAAKLRQELADKIQTVAELEATPPTVIWENDLNAIEEALDERDHYYSEAAKDELNKQSKSKKRSKPAPKKSRAKKVDSDDDDDDDFVITKKPVAKKTVAKASVAPKPVSKPAAVPAILKAPTIEVDSDEDSDEDVGGLSLMERMRQKKEGTSTKPVVASKPKASEKLTKPVKRPSPRVAEKIAEELDSFDATSFKAASLTPAPKKSRFVNKTSSLDFDSDEEESSAKVEKSNIKDKTTKIKSTVQKKLVKSDSEDDVFDDDESVDQESDDEIDFVPKPRAQRTARAAAKRVVYDVDDDSDSEFDFDE
jgi:DNA topoisomerase-2